LEAEVAQVAPVGWLLQEVLPGQAPVLLVRQQLYLLPEMSQQLAELPAMAVSAAPAEPLPPLLILQPPPPEVPVAQGAPELSLMLADWWETTTTS